MDITQDNNSKQNIGSNYSYANQLAEAHRTMTSLTNLLLEAGKILLTLRREFRGEAQAQLADGTTFWVQISKPIFCRMDYLKNIPMKENVTYPNGDKKIIFVPNDEAIEEVLSMLKFAGINQITSITNLSEENILDDLREFECKLAATLALKQKEWGLDKELLPMTMFKIKTIIQDARFMARQGEILKALTKTVSRVEQVLQGERRERFKKMNPYE